MVVDHDSLLVQHDSEVVDRDSLLVRLDSEVVEEALELEDSQHSLATLTLEKGFLQALRDSDCFLQYSLEAEQ